MAGKALSNRLRRIECQRGIGDHSRIGDEDLERRIEKQFASLPADALDALEANRQAGDIEGMLNKMRRLLDDAGSARTDAW